MVARRGNDDLNLFNYGMLLKYCITTKGNTLWVLPAMRLRMIL